MKKLLILLMFLSVVVVGCPKPQPSVDPAVTSGKTLLVTQKTIVGLRDAIGEPCQKSIIPQSACVEMDSLYQQSKPLYDAAVSAWKVGASSDYENKKASLELLLNQFAAIAIKYGVKP